MDAYEFNNEMTTLKEISVKTKRGFLIVEFCYNTEEGQYSVFVSQSYPPCKYQEFCWNWSDISYDNPYLTKKQLETIRKWDKGKKNGK